MVYLTSKTWWNVSRRAWCELPASVSHSRWLLLLSCGNEENLTSTNLSNIMLLVGPIKCLKAKRYCIKTVILYKMSNVAMYTRLKQNVHDEVWSHFMSHIWHSSRCCERWHIHRVVQSVLMQPVCPCWPRFRSVSERSQENSWGLLTKPTYSRMFLILYLSSL